MARNFYKQNGSYYYADNGQQILDLTELQNASNAGGIEISPEESTVYVDKLYSDAAANNPAISTLVQGGSSLEEVINGLSTGDLSGIVDWQGQPFSIADQQAALTQATEDNKLYYEAMQAKETADAEASMARDQENYQDYLINAGQSFEADKSKSDQKAADSGVIQETDRTKCFWTL